MNYLKQYENFNTPDGWIVINNHLYKKFKFNDFQSAFQFMTKVAKEAENLQHHPTWKNTYNIVEIWLNTHDTENITEKDYQLANKINMITSL
jgi:4a-hydroxytetrahydrobiopterin dehydratase